MATTYRTALVWLRRDLRLEDQAALHAAAQRAERVVCAFVLDPDLLRGPRMGAPIVQFFFESLAVLRAHLRTLGSDLALLEGDFGAELGALAERTGAQAVFYNVDYDPEAAARDERVSAALRARGLAVHTSVDHVYAPAETVLAQTGKPYTVYTPYRKRWQAIYEAEPIAPYPSLRACKAKLLNAAEIGATREVPAPEDYGHVSSPAYPKGGIDEAERLLTAFLRKPIDAYLDERNIPAHPGTSLLSPHLRAGTIGIRACVHAAMNARAARAKAAANIDGWIGELIWRDFYQQLLVHFPRIVREPFVEAGKNVPYEKNAAHWAAWCEGRTGYPIVDAAMIQLNTTGWMHNRLRMIVASFYTKHLMGDGERYFEQKLADADVAANNGGWQWSASIGTDAAPYFRVFNPTIQGKNFDPDGTFVKAMIPALARVPVKYIHEPWTMPPLIAAAAGVEIGREYPAPIVDHAVARQRAIELYGNALKKEPAAVKS
jgi:deoxyribodipyrimidine photo-lyase